MLFLSEAAIQYAVAKISEEENYRVYILCEDRNKCKEVMTVVLEFSSPDDIDRTHINKRGRYVFFKNGGSIRIFMPPKDIKHTISYHLLIVDEAIDPELLDNNISNCERLEIYKKFGREFLRKKHNEVWRNHERTAGES